MQSINFTSIELIRQVLIYGPTRGAPSEWSRLMQIRLKLFHNLRKLAFPESREFLFDYPLPEGAKVSDLLGRLNIPPELSILIFLNGEAATAEQGLKEGDLVSLMLPAGGG